MKKSILVSLLFAASIQFATNISAQLTIDSNFDSGDIGPYTIVGNVIDFEIASDGLDYEYWTNFKVSGVSGQTVTFNITNADLVPFLSDAGHESQMVYSYNGDDWFRLTSHSYTGGTYTFIQSFTEDIVQIATFFPFSYETMDAYVDAASTSEWATKTVLGSSHQGRDIDLLTITNDAVPMGEKEIIYLIGRQHAGETSSSHMLEGMIDFLLSEDVYANGFRNNYVWYIVPMVNPDGVFLGNSRANSEGNDPNRDWGNTDSDEINLVRDNITAINSANGIDMFIDWHSQMDDDRWYNFIYSPTGNTFFSILDDWTDFNSESASGASSCTSASCTARGWAMNAGLFTFVFEPTPHLSTWTEESLQQQGENTVFAINEYFGSFGDPLLLDSYFNDCESDADIRTNGSEQDWYESRNDDQTLLTLDETDVAGNTGKKAALKNFGTPSNAYLTQEFNAAQTGTFTVSFDIYIDRIADDATYDRSGFVFIGEEDITGTNGPVSTSNERFAYLTFYDDTPGTTGTDLQIRAREFNTPVQPYAETSTWTPVASGLSYDTWYTVTIDVDVAGGTYDVYVDDILYGEDIANYENYPSSSVEHIGFSVGDRAQGDFYIDNVQESPVPPPPAPPAAPSDLSASVTSHSQIDLTWTDNSDNETGFEIERSTTGAGGPFSPLTTLAANVTTYSNTELDPSTEYCYRVRATNGGGESNYSNVDCATTEEGPVVIFDDGFEGSPFDVNWNDNGATSWVVNTSYVHSGSNSARARGNTSEGLITTDDIDASGASSLEVDFWFRNSGADDDEVMLYYFNGSDYIFIADIFDLGDPSVWVHYTETITDPQFFNSNFRIQVNADMNSTSEYMRLDDVLVAKFMAETGPTLTMDVNPAGGGTTDPAAGLHSYSEDEVVTITPTPYAGCEFSTWSGADAGDLVNNGDGTWDLTMDDNKSLVAEFSALPAVFLADNDFEASMDSDDFGFNSAGQDWYESRGLEPTWLMLNETNVDGNASKKAFLQYGDNDNYVYLTQEFTPSQTGVFTISFDINIDAIDDDGDRDRTGMIYIGDDSDSPGEGGPNSGSAERSVFLTFFDPDIGSGDDDLQIRAREFRHDHATIPQSWNTTSAWTLVESDLSYDTWYTIRLEVNVAGGTYDVYVDDILRGDDINKYEDYSSSSVSHISFSSGLQARGDFYVDNVMESVLPGTIIIEKQTDPDDAPDTFEFTGDAAGTISDGGQIVVSDLLPGTYTAQEIVPEGWTLSSIVCDDGNSSGDVATGEVTFVLEAGETVTAVFTNSINRGTIIVEKQTDPDGAPDTFEFTGDAAGTISDGSQIVVSDLLPGTYTAQEIVPAGWALTSIVCDDGNSSGDVATGEVTFVLEAGETVTAVFTNSMNRGTIIVEKQTDPDDAPDTFEFTGDAAGTISDGGQIVVSDLLPGTYTAQEIVPAGWALTSIVCDDGNSSGDVATGEVTFVLEAGETVSAVFTNTVVDIDQDIPLSAGWNIFSLAVSPDNMDMQDIIQPLISEGTFEKLQDEAGNAIEYIEPFGWVYNVGGWNSSEGYKIRVNANTVLAVSGTLVSNPTSINLISGWNIMGYPTLQSQNAMEALESIIGTGHLLKVQDEAGNAIEFLPPIGWVDNIIDFDPGEGYKIKVSSECILSIEDPPSQLKSTVSSSSSLPSHFTTVYDNNGTDHMNIYITKAEIGSEPLEYGDEIAVYDGDKCVGIAVISGEEDIISVPASLDDPDTEFIDGFTKTNRMSLRIWDASEGLEIMDINTSYLDGFDGVFEAMGTTVLELKGAYVHGDIQQYTTSLGKNYPNPFNYETTICFTLGEKCKVRIEIYNMLGERVSILENRILPRGDHSIIWNGKGVDDANLTPGIYLYKMETSDYSDVGKMTLIK